MDGCSPPGAAAVELGADGLPFAPFTAVLRTLGVTTRGEAAATAHRLRLFDSLLPGSPTGP